MTSLFHLSQKIASRRPSRNDTFTSEYVLRASEVFEAVVKRYPTNKGKDASKAERSAKNNMDSSLTYGEIDFKSFARALERVKNVYGIPGYGTTPECGIMQKAGGVFYDLGSGTGKACVAAALLHPFSAVGGIEVLDSLHAISLELAREFAAYRIRIASAEEALKRGDSTRLDFYLGDTTDFSTKDWSDGDIIFMNSTCYTDEMVARIASAAENLKLGAIVITFTKSLKSKSFVILEQSIQSMSWGAATIFIHQKVSQPLPP